MQDLYTSTRATKRIRHYAPFGVTAEMIEQFSDRELDYLIWMRHRHDATRRWRHNRPMRVLSTTGIRRDPATI